MRCSGIAIHALNLRLETIASFKHDRATILAALPILQVQQHIDIYSTVSISLIPYLIIINSSYSQSQISFPNLVHFLSQITGMDSRRPSDASTFVDPASSVGSHNRLLEDFIVDSEYNTTLQTEKRCIPPLYTPAHRSAYIFIFVARLVVIFLNVLTMLFPIIGGLDNDSTPIVVVAFATLFITWIPMSVIASEHHSFGARICQENEGLQTKAGDRRVAVLVEDPVTLEERWMLEPKPKTDGVTVWLEQKRTVAGFDIYSCSVLLLSVILFAVLGHRAPAKMWVGMIVRSIML